MLLVVAIAIFIIERCLGDLVILSPLSEAKTYPGHSSRLNDFSWSNLTAQLVAVDTDACEVLNFNASGKIIMYHRTKSTKINWLLKHSQME